MSNENKSLSLAEDVVDCIQTKWIGCFIGLAGAVLSFIQAIVYSCISRADINAGAIVFSVLAVVAFLVLSIFKQTSPLAPVALMVCDFLALLCFASKIVDYYSTVFFGGFTISKFFGQEFVYWYSTLSFVITTIISFVAMYLPQNRKTQTKDVEVNGNEVEEV